jgi:PKD repeat protein
MKKFSALNHIAGKMFIFLAFLTLSLPVFSQRHVCYTDEKLKESIKNNPEVLKLQQEAEALIATRHTSMNKNTDTTLRIVPVVFHIIHQYGKENISKQTVIDQINTLNLCYRMRNADTSDIVSTFKSYKADFHYQFRLATIDPKGKCTDGIDRIYSTKTVNAGDNVKSLSWWDNTKYLNIWVVESIDSRSLNGTGTILGYAQFPWQNVSNAKTDGIIVNSSYVGNGAHTLVHEIGHWLGLFHPFQGGSSGSGCDNDGGDNVDDTPPVAAESFGCHPTANTCHTDKPDLPDMVQNFMDYSDCTHLFTRGQKDRIDVAMDNYRSKIYSVSNLAATGTDGKTIAKGGCTPKADFFNTTVEICEGGSVSFTNTSYYAPVLKYEWSFAGGSPGIDTNKNPVITYPKAGSYSATLKVIGSGGSDSVTKSLVVNVLPGISTFKAPAKQDFENLNLRQSGWKTPASADGLAWTLTSSASVSGSKSLSLNNISGVANISYSVSLPAVDMNTSKDANLWFQCAFAQAASSSLDEFEIFVSTDCGNNFNSVFFRSGARLATTHTFYPTSSVFVPKASEWKQYIVDLSAYKSVSNLIIKLVFTNNGGNNIYIDDLNIDHSTTGVEMPALETSNVNIFPNPASDMFTLQLESLKSEKCSFQLFDVTGRVVYNRDNFMIKPGTQEFTFNKQELNVTANGIYYIRILGSKNSILKKIMFN